jgi:hypothetical protein
LLDRAGPRALADALGQAATNGGFDGAISPPAQRRDRSLNRLRIIALLFHQHAGADESGERRGPIRDLDAHHARASLLALPTTQYLGEKQFSVRLSARLLGVQYYIVCPHGISSFDRRPVPVPLANHIVRDLNVHDVSGIFGLLKNADRSRRVVAGLRFFRTGAPNSRRRRSNPVFSFD